MMETYQLRVVAVCYLSCLITVLESVALEGHKNILEPNQMPIKPHKTSLLLLSRALNAKTKTGDDAADIFSQGSSRISHINENLHQCCIKGKHIVPIGLDITGNQKYVDIGRCRRNCRHKFHHHHHHYLRHYRHTTQKTSTNVDYTITENTFQKNCSFSDLCEPVSRITEIHHLLTGPREVAIVEKCSCSTNPPNCQRTSSIMHFFKDTPFETAVDVGSCWGYCNEGNSCVPLRNRTISVDGPNGATCVQVIEECQCTQPCYRMEFLEFYYERIWNDTINSTTEGVKEIDVGLCVGGCRHLEQDLFHCVLRDDKNPGKCLMSLRKEEPLCKPVRFNSHVFTTRSGAAKSVLSIEDCACQ
ncbi:uncharacterized protein LOC106478150 [Limulus polyphemus]|uniref:Uncharacterized protein LOC106478150 n=1 Tax=Limulus polyphemus TaxID=6850 RepID=A0ABM1S195_LIMPO|nr:uncharacterized protein LOC106478150 [Limulus polyphemus]